MSRLVYVEDSVAAHPRASEILRRLDDPVVVRCTHYGEIFNRRAQSFRLQKARPALILARKERNWIHPIPAEYEMGAQGSHYFSHLLNCPYDCRYCFLQGMFRSAHHVLFVNYEDFEEAIDRARGSVAPAAGHGTREASSRRWFYSGYDCDSLALEPLSGFARHFLPFFAARPDAWLELRTKSTHIEPLLAHEPFDNCVAAFSMTPAVVGEAVEHRVPALARRLDALRTLGQAGWRLGLRLDPILDVEGVVGLYEALMNQVFADLSPEWIDSVSIGGFRLPRDFYRRMSRLYPEERLFHGPLPERNGVVGYEIERERHLVQEVTRLVATHLPTSRIFSMHDR